MFVSRCSPEKSERGVSVTFVTQDETNQAMNKLKQIKLCVSSKTN